jgi:pyrroloquinoline quinone biosynthesis protein B
MMRIMPLPRISTVLLALVLAGAAAGCSSGPPALEPLPGAAPAEPYVLVLGTAQDGGLPHVGCFVGNCALARTNPSRRRLVTSLLLCDPRDGRRWLFDCTPDVREQLDRARGHPSTRKEEGPRPPLLDGLFLTHAHMGHYGGLLHFGREAYAVRELPAWITPRFAEFLRTNAPWSLLVQEKRLVLNELVEGQPVELAPDLQVTAFRVPHRDEFSDTVGFEIRGPNRALAYLPDIDKWERWDEEAEAAGAKGRRRGPARRVEELIERCDLALLDGCFFAGGEVAGRSMKEIPHPCVIESIDRFGALPRTERGKVYFTHLNHTNPAADSSSDAWRQVVEAGMQVLDEGRIFRL